MMKLLIIFLSIPLILPACAQPAGTADVSIKVPTGLIHGVGDIIHGIIGAAHFIADGIHAAISSGKFTEIANSALQSVRGIANIARWAGHRSSGDQSDDRR